jgi:hypothetical protein
MRGKFANNIATLPPSQSSKIEPNLQKIPQKVSQMKIRSANAEDSNTLL